MKTKKSVCIVTILILVLFLAGCLNYKPYQPTEEETTDDLLNEIAEIERELELAEEEPETNEITGEVIAEEEPEEITEEEITLPLDEEADYSDLQKIEVKENEIVDLQVKINDPDKDQISYKFSLPLNEQGKWKTNYGDAGEYVVTITATDGKLTSKKDILLVITKVNVPPIVKEIKDLTVQEGETVTIDPQVIDPNGDSVSVTISEPLPTGTWDTDHTSAGEYEIIVIASDGEKESKETFILTVTDVNVVPEIDGLKDITKFEGEKVKIKPQITDLDNDPVKTTITIICEKDCQFTNPGETVKTYTDEVVWETGFTDHGTYQVTVTADDGKDKTTAEITLVIKDENQPPEIGDIILG